MQRSAGDVQAPQPLRGEHTAPEQKSMVRRLVVFSESTMKIMSYVDEKAVGIVSLAFQGPRHLLRHAWWDSRPAHRGRMLNPHHACGHGTDTSALIGDPAVFPSTALLLRACGRHCGSSQTCPTCSQIGSLPSPRG